MRALDQSSPVIGNSFNPDRCAGTTVLVEPMEKRFGLGNPVLIAPTLSYVAFVPRQRCSLLMSRKAGIVINPVQMYEIKTRIIIGQSVHPCMQASMPKHWNPGEQRLRIGRIEVPVKPLLQKRLGEIEWPFGVL